MYPFRVLTFLTMLVILLPVRANAQADWQLKRSDQGIEVYTRQPTDSKLKELRVTCNLKASCNQLIAAIKDINHYSSWVYSTKQNTMLKVIGKNEFIYYSITHLPWPLADRDLVVDLTIIPQDANGKLRIEAKSLPAYLPVNTSYVRVPYSKAIWNVTTVDEHTLKVDYTLSVDPGGSIPAWLVNRTAPLGSYNSFLKLKMLLEKNASQ